ncbi:hypothetical protein WA026_019837 [Henosepilachna vigintioctopunctata]|uniref:Uncharacterized protein n=1 Tax=Henosepilachna vigintioctopunctata TaxID=420089 RepID=A0AAW1VIJ4_9CUCU
MEQKIFLAPGKCGGWAHLGCTNIKKEDAIQIKDFKWFCSKCEETDSERSSDEEILGDEALKTLHKRMSKNRKKSKAFNEVAMSTEDMFKKIINKITDLEQENKCIRKGNVKLKLDAQELKIEVSSLKHKTESAAFTADLKSREKNVILMGAQSKEEIVKVSKNLNSGLDEEDIEVRSIPSKSDMKPFIVTFNDKDTSDKVLLKRKDRGNLNSKNMHLEGVERNIYINEDSPIEVQKLLRKARELRDTQRHYCFENVDCSVLPKCTLSL